MPHEFHFEVHMGTAKPSSVLVLTCPGPSPYALINSLARRHVVSGIVFERNSRLRLLKKRIRKLGFFVVADQLLFKALEIVAFRRMARKKRDAALGLDSRFDRHRFTGTKILETRSVNSIQVQEFVRELRPDVVVVSGTSVLEGALLRCLKEIPVINVHVGITPRYRGLGGAFWAVVDGDWDNVGTTVHFVDEGIDTGTIIEQRSIELEPGDNPLVLGVKQYCVGIPMVVDAVSEIISGSISTSRRDDLDSKIFSAPTFTAYFRYRRMMGNRFGRGNTEAP